MSLLLARTSCDVVVVRPPSTLASWDVPICEGGNRVRPPPRDSGTAVSGASTTSSVPTSAASIGQGCGVCVRTSADNRLMSAGDQSDAGLGHRATTLVMDVVKQGLENPGIERLKGPATSLSLHWKENCHFQMAGSSVEKKYDIKHSLQDTLIKAIRCTAPNCSCDCFAPGKTLIRHCDTCKHGWVTHALDKLGFRHLFNCHQVELVQPSIAFDIASLMLYGTQAVPIRLKILLDRLFSVLHHEEVLHVLHGFSWTYEDYARGYILQDSTGNVLDRWVLATRDEEPLILQQFLRFGETKTIAQQLLVQESSERPEFVIQSPRTDSDIKKFIERTNRAASSALLKQNSLYITTNSTSSAMLPLGRPSLFRQPSSISSGHSLSPTAGSPADSNSPMAISPLNKLQNMQPYDFRREKSSPEIRSSENAVILPPTQGGGTPLSSPTTSIPTIPSISTTYTNHTSTLTVNSDFSATDGGSEDDTSHAINLSQTSTGMDSVFAARKVRHLRKSANPMKRRWNPMVLSTLVTNPSTGKKRVQCHVCLKTFCDKGALKIHFSAVHLREMHKCTVEGCNMMFSSRRSRNRHSANPNPKLHTPNFRRKLNPHDGRAANPFPIMPPTSLINFNNNLLPGGPNSLLDCDGSTLSDAEKVPQNYSSRPTGEVPVPPQCPPGMLNPSTMCDEVGALPLTKKCRVMSDDKDDDLCSNGGEEGGIDLSMKEGLSSVNRGVRKRKSLNPTKCAVTSDDDMQYVSTEDSSSDTYIDQDNDENGLLDSKSDDLSSDGMEDDSKDGDITDDKDELDERRERLERERHERERLERERERKLNSIPMSAPLPLPPPPISVPAIVLPPPPDIEKPDCESGNEDEKPIDLLKQERDPPTGNTNGNNSSTTTNTTTTCSSSNNNNNNNMMAEAEDMSENPLRHLETLSLGAFTNMVSSASRVQANHTTPVTSGGVSYHAPGLGLASSGTPYDGTRDSINAPLHDHNAVTSSHIAGPPICSDQDNSLSDQQMPMLPVYRDAHLMGSVDIPVDKENPRRCTACGKIFQNHFGVKTHYQNVHLKLMHKCTVEGCNAAFPSKRSRDRHSANLNLHRKLLSTSSEKTSPFFDKAALYPFPPDAPLRSEFFSRLYDPQSLPLSFADLYHGRIPTCGNEGFVGGATFPGHLAGMTGFHPAFMAPTTSAAGPQPEGISCVGGVGSGRDTPTSSITTTPSPQPNPPTPKQSALPPVSLEDELIPDGEGKYPCEFCEKKFHENVVLREHYEKCHTHELMQCTEDGCNKVFLSRRTRSLHNDDLHNREKASAVS